MSRARARLLTGRRPVSTWNAPTRKRRRGKWDPPVKSYQADPSDPLWERRRK